MFFSSADGIRELKLSSKPSLSVDRYLQSLNALLKYVQGQSTSGFNQAVVRRKHGIRHADFLNRLLLGGGRGLEKTGVFWPTCSPVVFSATYVLHFSIVLARIHMNQTPLLLHRPI